MKLSVVINRDQLSSLLATLVLSASLTSLISVLPFPSAPPHSSNDLCLLHHCSLSSSIFHQHHQPGNSGPAWLKWKLLVKRVLLFVISTQTHKWKNRKGIGLFFFCFFFSFRQTDYEYCNTKPWQREWICEVSETVSWDKCQTSFSNQTELVWCISFWPLSH